MPFSRQLVTIFSRIRARDCYQISYGFSFSRSLAVFFRHTVCEQSSPGTAAERGTTGGQKSMCSTGGRGANSQQSRSGSDGRGFLRGDLLIPRDASPYLRLLRLSSPDLTEKARIKAVVSQNKSGRSFYDLQEHEEGGWFNLSISVPAGQVLKFPFHKPWRSTRTRNQRRLASSMAPRSLPMGETSSYGRSRTFPVLEQPSEKMLRSRD